VKHNVDKLDNTLDYYYTTPIKIKNTKGQSLTINIVEMTGGDSFILQLQVNGTKSRLIRKMEEELIFQFNDSIKIQPVNRVPTNNNGESGIVLASKYESYFSNSIELGLMNTYFTYFKNYNLKIIRVYTLKDFADFKLTALESKQLKERFNCLIETVERNRKKDNERTTP
jgi:hypothetical protein